MKKLICVLFSVLLLCSCSSKGEIQVINKGLSYKAHIFYYGKEYECNAKILNDNNAVYTITEGSLKGFTVKFSDNNYSVSFAEKEIPFKNQKGMFYTLYQMNQQLSGQLNVKKQDGNYVIKGNTEMAEFELYVSPSGLPISAKLDQDQFYVNFYDVALIKL